MSLRVSNFPSCCNAYIIHDFPDAHGIRGTDEKTELELRQLIKSRSAYQFLFVILNGDQINRFRPMLIRNGFIETMNAYDGYEEAMNSVGKQTMVNRDRGCVCFISPYLSRNDPRPPSPEEAERLKREQEVLKEQRRVALEQERKRLAEAARRLKTQDLSDQFNHMTTTEVRNFIRHYGNTDIPKGRGERLALAYELLRTEQLEAYRRMGVNIDDL